MNKFKQCTYTMILLFTCLVASPMIFKQIWTNSAEKKKETKAAIEDIDIYKGIEDPSEAPNASAPANGTLQQNSPMVPNGNANNPPSEPMVSQPTGGALDQVYHTLDFVRGDYSYFDNALFIGDSRTVGIREYGSLGNADFFCKEGLGVAEAKKSCADGELGKLVSSGQYKKIYVMLGINEIGNDIDSTFASYRGLVENIRAKAPDALIFLQANMHVTFDSQTSFINNERINALNQKVSTLADKMSIFYIDVNPVFDDADGNLEAGYTSDGIHVLASIYQKWSDWYCLYTIPTT